MADRKADPEREAQPPARSEPGPRRDEAFRLACRRYSQLRARNPG
ncbi:MAG: hypothetical protein JWO81_2428 [Alphaproteobacteria bacterium]|nr:hypothetical protein [Alphaproteobacteria bacterium]